MSTKPKTPAGNFVALLTTKTGGVTLDELDLELANLVRQVEATGKPGTITYKIKISRNAKRGIKVDDDLAVKTPKESGGSSFFFSDDHGALYRNDPKQMPLKLAEVPSDETPVKAINA